MGAFKAAYHSLLGRVQGKTNCFCEGITNNAGDGKWFFFYDWDGGPHSGLAGMVAAARSLLGGGWEIRSTRGGLHLIDWTPRELVDVRKLWEAFQARFPSDYLWTVPLTLRDSPKWDYLSGRVVSPRPALAAYRRDDYPPLRVRRTYYRNWE